MQPENYSLEDLILDPDFIQWAKKYSSFYGTVWSDWASGDPVKQKVLSDARDLVLSLAWDDDMPSQQELNELWDRIRTTISQSNEPLVVTKIQSRPIFRFSIVQVAAAVAAVLVVTATLFMFLRRDIRFNTIYSQTKKVVLPDGSVVILNANSSVTYSPRWGREEPREVTLKGEGFFSVTHKTNAQKFIVHTHDLDIQVVGTKFDVNTRRGKTRVILHSGKVKLLLPDKLNKIIEMLPGQLVDFSSRNELLARKTVKPAVYSSWIDNKLTFEDASLNEIGQILEDSYGYKVKFSNEELANQRFTGSVDSDNIDLLLTILQKTFDIKIIKKEETIVFQENQ